MSDPDETPRHDTPRHDTPSADTRTPGTSEPGDGVARDWLGAPDGGARPDPMRAARGHARPTLPRRFYAKAGLAEGEHGHRLTLDGKPAGTPARNPLAVRSRALAERLAAEWEAQGESIDPASMPLTRLVNTAIDGVAPRRAAVAEDLKAYAGTDLVAYRADGPERLVAAQGAAWDPVVAWARDELGARLILGEGVMHVAQDPGAVAAIARAVDRVEDPFRLAALHTLTTLTGSLLIALAVLRGRLDAEAAWAAAHVDETYQAEVWGADAEAEARLAARRAEFLAAAEVMRLAD